MMSDHEQLDRPNIVILGVGHSGTTVVTNMLLALGWNGGAEAGDVDREYAEHIAIRNCNRVAIESGELPAEALRVVSGLQPPWVVKDPRMVLTLAHWRPIFAAVTPQLPTLVWITKDLAAVKKSHEIRGEFVSGEPGSHGHAVDELWSLAEQQYRAWPGEKLRIDFAQIAAATALYRPDATPGGPDLLHHTQRRVAALEAALAAEQQRQATTHGQLAALHDSLAKFAHDGEAKRELIESLKANVQHRADQVEQLQSTLAKYARDSDAKSELIEDLKRSLHDRTEQVEQLQQKLADFVHSNAAQTDTIKGLNESVHVRDERIAQLEGQHAERVAQIARLQEELAEYARSNAAQTESIRGLNESVLRREERIAQLESQHAERVAQIARLQQELAEYVRSNAAQTETIQGLNESVRWRDERLAQFDQQLVRNERES